MMEKQLIEKNDWLAPVWVSAYLQYVPGWLVVHVEYSLVDMEPTYHSLQCLLSPEIVSMSIGNK
jgi:hypothetical protein